MRSVKEGGLTLTDGNGKLGRVMNISLPPRLSCDTSMPCFSARRCYALRHAYLPYKEVRAAWDGNYAVWCREGPAAYFGAVKKAVAGRRPAMFRWHVGGDVPDLVPGEADAYIGGMVDVADRFPDTVFWAFTKRYGAARRNAKIIRSAGNLNVVLSAWPGVRLDGRTRRAWPVCYLDDPKAPDPRIPEGAFRCPGGCDKCLKCAGLKPGEAVAIRAH